MKQVLEKRCVGKVVCWRSGVLEEWCVEGCRWCDVLEKWCVEECEWYRVCLIRWSSGGV
jgi:hypothetical protein